MRLVHRARRVEAVPRLRLDALVRARSFAREPYAAILDSAAPTGTLGRWSFACSDPFYVLRARRGRTHAGRPGGMRRLAGGALDELTRLCAVFAGEEPEPWWPGLPPFTGGAIGYLGYELLYEIEPTVPSTPHGDRIVPDAYLLFCDTVLATDEIEGQSFVCVTGLGSSRARARRRADERLDAAMRTVEALLDATRREQSEREAVHARRRDTLDRLRDAGRLTEAAAIAAGARPVMDRARYLDAVRAAREHIARGDVFEVCVTNRFDASWPRSGAELFDVLRDVSPAPFGSYLRFPGLEVASSSPERFLRLDRDRWLETRPIKGTRPRARSEAEDRALAEELARSEKDLAENLMIVDLARNDLGRVSEIGSIDVPSPRVVESHPFTHQLVSTVRGRLRHELGAIDAIRAAFPGGSMTGAPKVEAMKIIDRLEPVGRGVYAGSIGYIDFDGAMDLGIVIRSFVKNRGALSFHVGGAIVADSDPADEHQEALDKAHGLVSAIEVARATL